MREFARLYAALDATSSTNAKVAAMADYFAAAEAADAAWAVYFLSGRRLKRLVGAARLREWLVAAVELPPWLVEASYADVGDLAETVALLMEGQAEPAARVPGLAALIRDELLPLAEAPAAAQQTRVLGWWRGLAFRERFLFTKLLTGALRVGVSQSLLARALARYSGVPKATLQHRLMGDWQPTAAFFQALIDPDTRLEDASEPYPFFLASPLEQPPAQLGEPQRWLAEWKWDGIRGQLIRRDGQTFLWSRGEELVTPRFPEIAAAAETLPDGVVLDGEILAWRDGVLGFQALQRRLNRKSVSERLAAEVPVTFLAYDLLEEGGDDLRELPQRQRRRRLEALLRGGPLRLSAAVPFEHWDELAEARDRSRAQGVEGLMLKDLDPAYGTGRMRGAWWKWKVDPLTIDAVLIYAQAGHGRRASLFTDYTFAVRDGDGGLLPIAKAYSGLTDREIVELDRWIRQHTRERFGPVRAVDPEHVFELSFEGMAPSSRHKSGIALRFPRIHRWRRELTPADADSLAQVEALMRRVVPAAARQAAVPGTRR